MATTLTIIPNLTNKGGKTDNRIAVGEKVTVTVKGLGAYASILRLRIRFADTDVAAFPWRDGDAWTVDGDDAKCVIDLNTVELRTAMQFRGDRGILMCLAMLDTGVDDTTRSLFCAAPVTVGNWLPFSALPDPEFLTDWKTRCNELQEALDTESERRIENDNTISQNLARHMGDQQNPHGVTAQQIGAAQSQHTHAQADVTGLLDALAGKASASHTHTKSEITDFPAIPAPSSATPQMDGTASAGSSDAYARGDHVHPTDTSRAPASHTHQQSDVSGLATALNGKAATADVALSTAAQSFGPWVVSPTSDIEIRRVQLQSPAQEWAFIPFWAGTDDALDAPILDEGQTTLEWPAGTGHTHFAITATRTATVTAYRMGPDAATNPNRDKTLAAADGVPAVVAPSTSATAGQAADAKATGDALAAKMPSSATGFDIPCGGQFPWAMVPVTGMLADVIDTQIPNIQALIPSTATPSNKLATADALSTKVPETRKINNKSLSADVTLTASDVGALADTVVSSIPANGVYISNGKLGAAVNGPVTIDADGMINLNSEFVAIATEQQVPADWSASSGVAQILNKPNIIPVTIDTQQKLYTTTTDVQQFAVANSDQSKFAYLFVPQASSDTRTAYIVTNGTVQAAKLQATGINSNPLTIPAGADANDAVARTSDLPPFEIWTFELNDSTTVTKKVAIYN